MGGSGLASDKSSHALQPEALSLPSGSFTQHSVALDPLDPGLEKW